MLVATAGHVDHGKTSLIRALTGVDTDRLPEERARGISIDLGFAYWRPESGRTIGFVDVPGHERFVRNMLAGVGAADFALLVVAADDGVKPQTVEHTQILDLLGVSRGMVAITKCDRCQRQRIDEVREQVRALLQPTCLAAAPLFEVSTATGAGVAQIANALVSASRSDVPRFVAGRHFRLAVDRAFTVSGAGTVVTGTVLDGEIETGAHLVVSPRGLPVRVRGLQCAGIAVPRVQTGERCALNLADVEVADVHRGDWLLTTAMHSPSARMEARLRVLPAAAGPLKHHCPVQVHLGTAALGARVLIPGQTAVAVGAEAVVQLAFAHPACAITGDRFVVRDQAGRRLIGGGRVIDPIPAPGRRQPPQRAAITAAMERLDASLALPALLAISDHEVDIRHFERSFNLQQETARQLFAASGAVSPGGGGTHALSAERVTSMNQRIVDALTRFHLDQPEAGGMTIRDLRDRLATHVSTEVFLALLKDLGAQNTVTTTGSFVRLAGHQPRFSGADSLLWQKILARLRQRESAQPFTVSELSALLGVNEAAIKVVLYRRRSNGEVWRITEKRFMLREQVATLAAQAAQVAQSVGGKGFTAAQYRDAIGTGRTLAIQILEFFDSISVTLRQGDLRRMRTDYQLVVGNTKVATLPSNGGDGIRK